MGKKRRNTEKNDIVSDGGVSNKRFIIVSIIVIILAVIATYSNSYENSFQYDDVHHVFDSRHNKNFESFKDPGFWFNFTERAPAQFTLALNYHFGEYSVKGYHLVNIAIHILASILVFLFGGLILNSDTVKTNYIQSNRKMIQLFSALIFAVHPLQTESVTYIVQRMESLSFVFYLSALIFYLMFRYEKNAVKKYVKFSIFIITGMLSVMTKQTAYTLPLSILLTEIYFIRNKNGESNKKLIYTLIILLSSALIIGLSTGALPQEELADTNRINYMLSQFVVIPRYIFLLLIPVGQNIDHHIIIPDSIFSINTILGALLIIIMLYSSYKMYKKGHLLLSFSIAWFFAVISLRSSILPISDLMSEHRMYPALFGYGIFAAVLVSYLKRKMSFLKKSMKFAPVVLGFITLLYALTAYERNKVWKDELTLWKDSVSKSPDKFRPNYNAAEAYRKSGRSYTALQLYLKAYSINNKSFGLCNNIGNIYSGENNYDQAEKYYIKALDLNPEYPKSLNNLANIYFKTEKYKEAEELYLRASRNDPDFIDPVLNLGHLYSLSENYELALNNYKRALEIDPDNEQARNNLSLILLSNAQK